MTEPTVRCGSTSGAVAAEPFATLEQAVAWFATRLMTARRSVGQFAAELVTRAGLAALDEQPSVIVGTIHSVKGGEADDVILFPDLSVAGWGAWLTDTGREEIRRLIYVGATRARRGLYLAAPQSPKAVPWR